MSVDRRLVICAAASVAGHLGLARVLDQLPSRVAAPPAVAIVQVRVVTPPVEPPPLPVPAPVPPPPEVAKRTPPPRRERARPVASPPRERVLRDPSPDPPQAATSPSAVTMPTPVFGVTLASTSQAGTGPAVAVGNTLRPAPIGAPGTGPGPVTSPVAAVEVTRMPLPRGSCAGTYTEAARAAAIEGVVVLDLIVDEHGRARDITVVAGLPHGLTEAAIAALTACRFTPGEKAGQPVAVSLRGFKIRFVLQDGG